MSADEYILVNFYHGEHIVKDPVPRYVGERGEDGHIIDKDHFSLFELLSYTKDMGYAEVEVFYLINPKSNDFVLIENDEQLYNTVCHLNHLDHLDLFIKLVVMSLCWLMRLCHVAFYMGQKLLNKVKIY